ncbi:uncharacterized protein LOC130787876 isoform X5 [Actinidia eriantha]|uniref:uncharacterized protein LOC130787876 isoform X5 n=1 Tax=Actinidia eriantha TaxID=165200 RepID=UPI00258EDDA1|nr:uncharacterized protein LOC130787876 isoform X5 [Actinidia eriantha]
MAAVTAPMPSGARLWIIRRTLSTPRCSSSFSSSSISSNLGLSLQLRRPSPARKLVVRAEIIESKRVSLGSRAPQFQLPEPLTGKVWKLEDFEAYPALLVMFICNHCPFVKNLKKDIVKLSNFYMKKGLAVVAISSNSVATHPQDGPEFMEEEAKLFKYPFPYLYDERLELSYRLCSQWPSSIISSETECWMQHKVASLDKAVMCSAGLVFSRSWFAMLSVCFGYCVGSSSTDARK